MTARSLFSRSLGGTVKLAGLVSLLVGAVVIIAWLLASRAGSATLVARLVSMHPNTAVGFVLCGLAVLALTRQRRRWALLVALLASSGALLTSLQFVMASDFGIDQLLAPPAADSGITPPARMPPNSAVSIACSAVALALLGVRRRTAVHSFISGVLSSTTVALGAVALLGHSADIVSAYRWGSFPPMAIHTAAALLVLGDGILLLAFADASLEHFHLPRWLPISTAVAGVAGTLCLWQALARLQEGLLKRLQSSFLPESFAEKHLPELALASCLVVVALFSLAIYLNQKASLRARERKHALLALQQTHHALRQAHGELERRVESRTQEISQVNRNLNREVSARKALERKLRQRAKQLGEAARKKDEFLAILGHELRNPLATLALGLETLALDGCDGVALARTREIMRKRLQYVVRLVDDLLDVSRVTHGKITLRRSTVDLSGIVSRVVQNLQPAVQGKGHCLSVSLPAEPLFLEADEVRLEQVVFNLLSNAVQYTEDGGRIWVSAKRAGALLLLRVKDTGVGIAPELMPRIFESFTRACLPRDSGHGGLGVGLTLVDRIVKLHGGIVKARSDGLGKGSEFIVILRPLPVGRKQDPGPGMNAGPGPAQEAKPAVRSPPCRRVLIVEDQEDLATLLQRLLGAWGHHVRVANDGAAALQAAAAEAPEVALIDVGLPGMDGCEVAARLRRLAGKQILLVALTGYSQSVYQDSIQAAGFDCHLVKPVDFGTLKRLLNSGAA